MKRPLFILLLAASSLLACANTNQPSQQNTSAPLQSIAALEVKPYMGTWYQVALFPNAFQSQCISDTTANYSLNADGTVTVKNRCKKADGKFDEAMGKARAIGNIGKLENPTLSPAKLEVRFAPAWLSWLPVVWGAYWVIDIAGTAQEGYRYALVSEPKREYLWVLSRTPKLSAEDETRIRATLTGLGFDLNKLQTHLHNTASP